MSQNQMEGFASVYIYIRNLFLLKSGERDCRTTFREDENMKRKLLSVILAAAMVTAMLAGCGSKEAEAPAAAEGETETES